MRPSVYYSILVLTLFGSSFIAPVVAQVPPNVGQIVISEFRMRGPGGAGDEFVEIQNVSNVFLDISGCRLRGSSSGGVVANRLLVASGTTLQPSQHFLMVLPSGYSLGSYPAGNGTTATSDLDYALGIANDGGLALTLNDNSILDQVGMSPGSAFGEGARLAPLETAAAGVNASYVRRMTMGLPQDTDNNAADFVLVSTDGNASLVGAILGAPGPQNRSSPLLRNGQVAVQLLDTTAAQTAAPNRVRDLTPVTNGQFGTMSVRRRVTNNTGAPITRLRFRVIIISTSPPPDATTADLRVLTSVDATATVNDPVQCGGSPPCTVTVLATTLEQPPNQSLGGGLNSSLSVGTVNLESPLAVGAFLNAQVLLGVQQRGTFRAYVNVEALP